MKTHTKIKFGLFALIAGLFVYRFARNRSQKRRFNKVAEEGYESAVDMIYPAASGLPANVHVGPVLPS